jgi:hypothetical protein
MPSKDSNHHEEGENTKEELVTDWKRIGYKYMTVTTCCPRSAHDMLDMLASQAISAF